MTNFQLPTLREGLRMCFISLTLWLALRVVHLLGWNKETSMEMGWYGTLGDRPPRTCKRLHCCCSPLRCRSLTHASRSRRLCHPSDRWSTVEPLPTSSHFLLICVQELFPPSRFPPPLHSLHHGSGLRTHVYTPIISGRDGIRLSYASHLDQRVCSQRPSPPWLHPSRRRIITDTVRLLVPTRRPLSPAPAVCAIHQMAAHRHIDVHIDESRLFFLPACDQDDGLDRRAGGLFASPRSISLFPGYRVSFDAWRLYMGRLFISKGRGGDDDDDDDDDDARAPRQMNRRETETETSAPRPSSSITLMYTGNSLHSSFFLPVYQGSVWVGWVATTTDKHSVAAQLPSRASNTDAKRVSNLRTLTTNNDNGGVAGRVLGTPAEWESSTSVTVRRSV
ncbi:hypothetical protein IWZ00DRAFT_378339 [Phyllosticta capitalensis]